MPAKGILIVSNTDDAHAEVICKRLKKRSISVHRIDSDALMSQQHSWRICADASQSTSSSWAKYDADVVWYRKVVFPEPTDLTQSFVRQELQGLLDSVLFQYRDCRWVNPRDRLAEARAELPQLQRAKEIGFRIPDTLVTTDLNALKEFATIHQGNIVAKPMRTQVIRSNDQVRVVGTRRLQPEYYESAVARSPCFAQEYLAIQSEIRVVAFGTHLHAFRLTALDSADDIKQLNLDQIRHEPYKLEEGVASKIYALMSLYQLEFAAIDFVVVDDDEPVFLELNPNGQWLWLQYMTGINLEDPFIDFLCS